MPGPPSAATQWPDDDLRPLTEEGKKRFAQVVAKTGRARPGAAGGGHQPAGPLRRDRANLGRRRCRPAEARRTRRAAAGQRPWWAAGLDRTASPQTSAGRLGRPRPRRRPHGRRADRPAGRPDPLCQGRPSPPSVSMVRPSSAAANCNGWSRRKCWGADAQEDVAWNVHPCFECHARSAFLLPLPGVAHRHKLY